MPAGTGATRKPRDAIYQLKVTLRGSKPPIWRRIQVPGAYTLDDLHAVLQVVMGWHDAHLHQFIVGPTYYAPPEFELDDPFGLDATEDSARVTLRRVAPQEGAKFIYQYDFGDDWEHAILVEKILPPDPAVRYPVCVAGRRAAPPEDCGGIWGYAELLEILQDPQHPEREERLEWLGGEFDPAAFDLEGINRQLQQLVEPPPAATG